MIELCLGLFRIASIAAVCGLLPVTEGWSDAHQASDRFEAYLAVGYREISAIADRNGERALAQHFLARARSAASAQAVAPEAPGVLGLGAWTAREAGLARAQLVARLEGGARQAQPLLAAIAQVNFDCWVAPLPARIGVPGGDECRRRFYFAFAGLRAVAPQEKPATSGLELAAASGTSAPKPPPTSEPGCLGGSAFLDCAPIAFTGVAADNLIRLLRAGAEAQAASPEGALASGQSRGDGQSDGSSGRASTGAGSANDAVGEAAGSTGSVLGQTAEGVGATAAGAVGSTTSTLGGSVSSVGRAAGSLLK
jgi:hypothetical protein